jgi:protein SCO1/2
MGRTQKIFTTGLWAIVVIGMIALVATRAFPTRDGEAKSDLTASSEKFSPLYDTPAFELTDQNGKTFAKTDLMGKVWIADFVFTHCGGPCPIMSSKLAEIQKQVDRPAVKLVSFSVDPERDTPAVLKEYARTYGADESRWSFLTGPKQAIYDTAAAMKITAIPATADAPIIHSDLFLLVDRAGQVVGVYHSNDNDRMKQLVADATELADRKQ